MENGQLHDDKLFRAVHDRLSDYEAPANGADWDAMSRSLNNLPKTSRFQWKISLNSILVILGITGLSVLGFAWANHSGKPKTNSNAIPVASEKQDVPVTNTSLVNNAPASQKINSSPVTTQTNQDVIGNNSALNTNPNPLVNVDNRTQSVPGTAADGKTKTKKHNSNDLYFGDQIDPRKGFIYNTQEDKSSLTAPGPISNPDVFYDVDNGQIRKIVHKDSTGKNKTFASDSTATNNQKPGAPVDGGTTGFDPQGQ